MIKKMTLWTAATALAVVVACAPKTSSDGGAGDATIAYVTNGIDPFWDLCAAGVHQAEKEFGVRCEIHMPTKGLADQKSLSLIHI